MRNSEVVIIGGGIHGISLAYHLARRGLVDVCLLEKNMLGCGSSGKSASVIGHAFQSEECLALTRWSYGALRDFRQEVGVDPGFEPIGCLLLTGSRGAVALRDRHQLLEPMRVDSHLVDADTIDKLTPGLNLEGIEQGLYLPQDGGLDPHAIMMGYTSSARRMGVRFMEGVEATGLRIERDRVVSVDTTAGSTCAGWVVNAAGAFARQVAAWAHMDLPITNLKRHILVTGPVPTYVGPLPFTYEWETAWYLRREGPGLLIGMGASECDADDERVEAAFVEKVIDYSTYRAPALEHAGLLTSWAGIRPMPPDEEPILGKAAHLPNFVNDCGWGGVGVMNAPAAGMALSEVIVDGLTTTFDISPFRAERFTPE